MIKMNEKPFSLNKEDIDWVEHTLSNMSLEEKVGHLFCVNYRTGSKEELDYTYSILSPGACMFRPMPYKDALVLTKQLQEYSKIPLLVAANLEKGGNGIVQEGTLFASPMEVAATGDVDMAHKMGVVCAKEGGAVGANWSFAPIIDIDYNFRNPITSTRTFGSDPHKVAEMGLAYIEALQSRGFAATIKHFPGDGCDERDHHLVTSINDMSCEDWDKTYGAIYKQCIDAGAMSVMVGQIMQPAYSKKLNPALKDEDILPASLSHELMNGLLREKLGFNGLIVTDATTMAGFMIPMPRDKAVPASIAAGADMFLFARNLQEDYTSMLNGVKDGIITLERLDEAVRRILATKATLKLHHGNIAECSEDAAGKVIGCAQHKDWASECADKAITLVKEEQGILPLSPQKQKRILLYAIEKAGGAGQYGVVGGKVQYIKERLEKEGFVITEFVPPSGMEGHTPTMASVIDAYDLILYVANIATKSNQTTVRIEWAQPMGANCPHFITTIPTIFVSLENPYHLLDVPRIKTFINTYSSADVVLDQLVEKLMGRSEFVGVNPVDPFCGKWDTRL